MRSRVYLAGECHSSLDTLSLSSLTISDHLTKPLSSHHRMPSPPQSIGSCSAPTVCVLPSHDHLRRSIGSCSAPTVWVATRESSPFGSCSASTVWVATRESSSFGSSASSISSDSRYSRQARSSRRGSGRGRAMSHRLRSTFLVPSHYHLVAISHSITSCNSESSKHRLITISLPSHCHRIAIVSLTIMLQLCINFANEKLQRNFTSTVFSNEEGLYAAVCAWSM